MTSGSLRLRLFLAAAMSLALALFLTGLALFQIFESQVRARVLSELDNNLLQLAGAIEVSDDGAVNIAGRLADPRFGEPYGGRYWRIDFAPPDKVAARKPLQSRSLWDADLDRIKPRGPQGEPLIVTQRHLSIDVKGTPLPLWLMVAASEKEIARPLGQFREQLLLAFGLIGAVLSLGAWLQVTVGLGPLRQLRQQIAAIRAGSLARLQGDFPNEVAPLVGELNDVIEARDASLERARRRAGDLAHGLKTPLTVLSAIARDLRKSRRRREAADIEAQTETMRIHVERALARARLSTGRGHAVTELRPVAEKVIATLQRLPDAGKLVFDLAVPPGTMVPMEQGDLTEFLGNLLDNARKWAASRVRIGYAERTLAIDDDGPGVDEENIRRIVERGRRLDEAKQGSGLGLSIVQDIADIYNLNVVFGRSDLGGLKVAIRH